MPDDRLEHSIFISFAEEDLSFVEGLVRPLRDRGFEPWYYLTSMKAGDQIHQRLMQAIVAATEVIVVVSRHSGQSQYVTREISFAQQQGKPIIPLVLNEPNDDSPLKLLLADIHRIDAQRGHDYMPQLQQALNIPPRPLPYGSPIFKAVQKKRCKALYRALKKSLTPPESAVGAGSERSHVDRSVGASQ